MQRQHYVLTTLRDINILYLSLEVLSSCPNRVLSFLRESSRERSLRWSGSLQRWWAKESKSVFEKRSITAVTPILSVAWDA